MDTCLCLCELLKASAAACERELNEALADIGISHCQASVLVKITDGGSQTMSAISKELCCHKSNVTQVVDGLVAKGLIARKNSKTDRRVCTLVLTKKGKALSAKAQVLLKHRADLCLDSLDTKDRILFKNLLQKMLGRNSIA